LKLEYLMFFIEYHGFKVMVMAKVKTMAIVVVKVIEELFIYFLIK